MNNTKITSASVKVTLAHNGNFFGVELAIENEDGITPIEVNDTRQTAQELAECALNDFRTSPKTLKNGIGTFDGDAYLNELATKKAKLNKKS